MKQREITDIIIAGVNGMNSNMYQDILISLMVRVRFGKVKRDDTITAHQLYKALKVAEAQQDKAIDKYLEQDVS